MFLHTLLYDDVLAEIIKQTGKKNMILKITVGPKGHGLLSLNMSVTKLLHSVIIIIIVNFILF